MAEPRPQLSGKSPSRALSTLPPCLIQGDLQKAHFVITIAGLFQCFWAFSIPYPPSCHHDLVLDFEIQSLLTESVCGLFFSCSLNKRLNQNGHVYHLKTVLYLEREGVGYYWHLTFVE